MRTVKAVWRVLPGGAENSIPGRECSYGCSTGRSSCVSIFNIYYFFTNISPKNCLLEVHFGT